MLCIAVAPVSRQLGKVDLLNAAPQCDLIEFRLDRLGKTPDIADMISGISKPILISCRRQCDGGSWDGSEEERLTLLRSAIVAGPAYVELELDIASKVPRFGKTKRVINYTRLDKPLGNLEPVFKQAAAANADVVKFVGPTPTLDAAWPLLAAVSKKRDIPVVGMGLGRSGLTFTLLGCKYGSPWTYAALEKGMEAHDGQATISELEDTYRFRDITSTTRFIAVTGFGPTETTIVKVLNAAFADSNLNIRCLPIELGRGENFSKMLDSLKISVVVGNPRVAERLLNLATELEDAARVAQYADLLIKQQDEWKAYNTVWRTVLRTLELKLGAKTPDDRPLDRRNVLIIGSGGAARGVAFGIQRRKGLISVTADEDSEAKLLAQQFSARFVPHASMYDTLCDVVILTEARSQNDAGEFEGVKINPSFLRPHMTVTDMSDLPADTELLREARLRGCSVVEPANIFSEHLVAIFKIMTGKPLPDSALSGITPPQE